MTKRILILFFLFITFTGNAQNIKDLNQIVANFIKTENIDIAFTYERYSVGGITIVEPGSLQDTEKCITDLTNHPIYVFWKNEGKTYATKISYCFDYSKIIIDNDDFWEIYLSNKTLLENEKVKPFEYITIENSKEIKHQVAISHSDFQKLKLFANGNIFEKLFDEFDLQKGDNFDTTKNINYENNINLKSKLIVDALGKIVKEAETNNIFIKTKSR